MRQPLNNNKRLLWGGIAIAATLLAGAAAWTLRHMFTQDFEHQEANQQREKQDVDNVEKDAVPDQDGVSVLSADGFEVAALTHSGKRRANNQDYFRLGEIDLAGSTQVLAVVCDGMGGHAGGEVASRIAADIIWTVLSKQTLHAPQSIHQSMHDALERADAAIEQRASKERDLIGMGTTAVIATIDNHEYIHCYLGDSRLYHLSGESFVYQTKDHSVVRFLVEEGIIAPEEAKDHPYRSQLTSSLGGGPNANRLTIEPKWDSKDSPRQNWKSGDWLVLCSDGLNSELDDIEIAKALLASKTAKEAALSLRDKVLQTEARDNVTVIVARKV